MNAATLLKVVLLISEVIRNAVSWHTKEERDERIRRIKDDPVAEWNRRVARVSAMDDWPARDPDELPAAYTGAVTCYRAGRLADACRPTELTAVLRSGRGLPPIEAIPSDEELEQLTTSNLRRLDPPNRQTSGAAGYDLPSAIDIVVREGDQVVVPTGWRLAIPTGYYGKVESRSGWALKARISHRAGVIDEDYRGEVRVLLTNEGTQPFRIKRGDRIAQLIIQKYEAPDVVLRHEFTSTTDRGSGGFGSTGGGEK